MTRVYIPTPLRSYTGVAEVSAEGVDLRALVADLDRQYPGIAFRVVDEQDRVRRHIKFFIGEHNDDRLDAPIPPGVDVHIVAALSGG